MSNFNNKKLNIDSMHIDKIDMNDYPKFVDAYIDYIEYEDGIPLNDNELEELNDSELKYELIQDNIHLWIK